MNQKQGNFGLRKCILYIFNFLLIINILFIPKIEESRETTSFLILASVILSLLVMLFSWLIGHILRKRSVYYNPLFECFILFLISEIAFVIISGEIGLFGVLYRLNGNASQLSQKVVSFREKRDFAFSTSFLIASGLYFVESFGYKFWIKKRDPKNVS
jgi:hypothetical protein